MNSICNLFGIRYPLIQAGMIWCSGWELASAVSNAGALGLIGAGSMYPEILREQIRKCRVATDKPFGVNVPLLYPDIEKHMQIIVEEGVKIVFTSAGNPVPIPPAAISGMLTVFLIRGVNTIVVVSSLPLCPPASKPSATIASTPAACAFKANFVLAIT